MSTKTKQKKVTLLFPVTGKDGTVTYVSRKDYLAQKSKEFGKEYKGVDVDPKTIGQILGFVEEGAEMEDETDPKYLAIYKVLDTDYTAAKEHHDEEEAAKNAESGRELTILTTALSGSITAEELDAKFTVSATGVEISEDATDEEIATKMLRMLDFQSFSSYAIGDLGNELKRRGREHVIDNLMAKTGRAGSTIYGHMELAEKMPKDKRGMKVLPTTAGEIVKPTLSDNPKKDAEIKNKLLKEAEEKNWTSREARAAAVAARTKKAGKQGNASAEKKPDFLLIKDGVPTLAFEEPATGYDDDVLVINIRTRQVFTDQAPKPDGKEGEVVIGWIDLEVEKA